MNRWVLTALLLVVQPLFSGAVVAQSADTSLSSELTLQLNQNGDGSVFQQVTFSGVKKAFGNVVVNLPFKKVEDLTAAYDDGIKIPHKLLQDTSESTALQLSFKRAPVNNQYKVLFEYSVPGAMDDLKQIQIPNLSQSLPVKSNLVRVMVPLTVGVVTSLGMAPQKEGLSVGSQEFVFKLSPKDSGIVLSAARDITYSLNFSQTISNEGFMPKRVDMILPPDLHNQKATYKDISPEPQTVRLDEEGNVIAQYLLWPKQSKEVNISMDVSVSKLQYDFSKVRPLDKLPELITERYTQNSGVWKEAATLKQFVTSAISEAQTSPIKTVEEVNNEIIKKLEPSDTSRRLSVDQILKRNQAFSHLNYSDLLVASLRSKGVPARLIVGKRYDPGSLEQTLSDHSWVEAYMPGVGWVAIDPFLGEETDTFGTSDVGKIALFVGSDNGTLVSTVFGTDTYSERAIHVNETKNELTMTNSALDVVATKYVLFPGISFIKSDTKVTNGVAIDNITLNATKAYRPFQYLGSLAPFEKRTNFNFSFLKAAFSTSEVAAGFGNETSTEEQITSTEARANYWPFIGLLSFIAALIGLLWWLRKRPKRTGIKHVEDNGDGVEITNLLSNGTKPKTSTMADASVDEQNNSS